MTFWKFSAIGDRASARDDGLGAGQLRPLGLGDLVGLEGGDTLVLDAGGHRLDRRLGAARAGGLEGGGAHGDDLLRVLRLNGLDRVAGVDRPLEGVGGDHLGDIGDLHHVEQGGGAGHGVLRRRRRGRDDRIVIRGQRDEQSGQRLGHRVAVDVGVGGQHLLDALRGRPPAWRPPRRPRRRRARGRGRPSRSRR